MNDNKRFLRELKREIKKLGSRNRRHVLKQWLKDHPDEAHWDEYDFKDLSTKSMNGKYLDTKRD